MSRYWPLIKLVPQKTNLEFVRFAKAAGIFSALAVLGSIFMTLYPLTPPCGGLNCGVDFRGGTVIEISTAPKAVDLAVVRSSLRDSGLGDVQVQGFGADTDALVRFETPAGADSGDAVTRVRAQLTAALGNDVVFKRTEVVGPKVSNELLTGGALALAFAVGLMLIYIWFRFEWQFALGAVAGLLHDTILVFGLFAVTKMEFSLTAVAAILTVIGYSMNDTVVVFDRLRENLRKYKRMPLGELINLSINETLSRTIITGVTSVFALGVLAALGGESLFPFSVALMFGIVFGTYSSIYVAAPIILIWGVKRGDEVIPGAKPARP